MWPDHCVMKSEDAELAEQVGLEIDHDSDIVIQKGFNCEVRFPEYLVSYANEVILELHQRKGGLKKELLVLEFHAEYLSIHK